MNARIFTGRRGTLSFKAALTQSKVTTGECRCCGGPVKRSWRTGLLHQYCFGCRYLRMIYGPSIRVERIDDDKAA